MDIKDVTRDEDTGFILSTGNLYIRNLETGEEMQLTDYTGAETILNPAFTSRGDEVVFTAKFSGVDYFRVFKIGTEYTHTDLEVGGPDILYEIEDTDLKYAALSPDGTKLVYTKEKNESTTQLCMNELTGSEYDELVILVNQDGQEIRHPVFLDNETLVYIGIVNEVQDIYRLNVNGFSLPVNLTNNPTSGGDISPQYGRLKTSSRADTSYQNMVVYSKRVWQTAYGRWSGWDVEVGVISGNFLSGYPVTDTTDIEEFAPSFWGDKFSIPELEDAGSLIYSANIFNPDDFHSRDIWQTNYDISGANNTVQVVLNRSTPADLPDWAPIPSGVFPTPVPIEDTRLIYIDESGRVVSQDFSESGSLLPPDILTDATNQAENPSLSGNGSRIAYDVRIPSKVYCMAYNGSDLNLLEESTSLTEKQPGLSADGRWAVYVRNGGLYAKLCTSDVSDTETPLLTGINPFTGINYSVRDPSFSQDMNRILFRDGMSGTGGNIYTVGVFFSEDGTGIYKGFLQRLTNDVDYDDMYPSFSPDGSKVIFTSNRGDIFYSIYEMESNGSNIRRLRQGGQADTQEASYPVYTPMNDGSYAWSATSGSEKHIYHSNTGDTGIVVKGDSEKFAWGMRREEGSIVATRRRLPERIAKGAAFTYNIFIDVDEVKKPNSYSLEETIPPATDEGWWVIGVMVDGGPAEYDIVAGTDEDGNPVQKIIVLFWNDRNGGVADHFVRIAVLVGTNCSGMKSPEGMIYYRIDGDDRETEVGGGDYIKMANPYIPVDIYTTRGEIGASDLLYAIDCWAENLQLEGIVSSLWPVDTNNWDFIILKVIDIWATDTGGYRYDGGAPAGEMYWSAGLWSDY